MKKIKYKQLTLLLFASLVFVATAQENRSPASMEKMKLDWMWSKTSNAAGIKLDSVYKYSVLNAGYNIESGDFHRVMNGEKSKRLAFSTEGGVDVNKFYFWGKFNYSRDAIKDAMYNASIIDPYRGMPYAVADTNSSDWNNQHYELEFKISLPKLNDRLSIGLDGQYHASLGAKQRDIRTENYYMLLALRPGVVYSFNKNNHLGVNLEYYSIKEESKMGNVNVYVDQPFYQLYGLGNATIGIGGGRTTNYIGNNLGGGVQYNYSGVVNLLLSGNYSVKVEDAKISFTNPRKDGSVVDRVWNNKLLLNTKGRDYTHYFEMEYTQRGIKGIEYITEYDDSESYQGYVTLDKNIRSTYNTKEASVGYKWTKNKNREYVWLLGAGVSYLEFGDKYILPFSSDNGKNAQFELLGRYNLIFKGNLNRRLLFDANFMISNNLSGSYSYGGAFKEYPVNDKLVGRDNDFNNSEFWRAGMNVTYSQKVNSINNIHLYVKGGVLYAKANSFGFNNRKDLVINIGCNF